MAFGIFYVVMGNSKINTREFISNLFFLSFVLSDRNNY